MGFIDESSEMTHILVVSDPAISLKWYKEVLGASVHNEFDTGAVIKVIGNWMLITKGGEPTQDKPETTLKPPTDLKTASALFTIRVKDCKKTHRLLKDRGATFLTEPIESGREIRCFFSDPDRHLFEISEVS